MSKSLTQTGRKRKRDISTGWIPTKRIISDISYSLSTDSPVKVYKFLEHMESITRVSFDHGLSSLLLLSCEVGNFEVFNDLFHLSLPLFSIDHVYTYNISYFPLSLSSSDEATSEEITVVQNLDLNTCRTNTLLHIAAESCDPDIVAFLVQHGATVDTLNCCGRTPLMVGIRSKEVTEYLIGVGANVNHRDKDEYSALMLVVIYNLNISIFKLLLDAGAQPYVCDIYGNSLLSLISSCRCTDPLVYLEELFSHGVFPDCDTHGQLQYSDCPLYLKNTSPIVWECFSTAKDLRNSQMHRLSLKYQALLSYLPPEPFREHFAELLEEKAKCGLHFHPAPIPTYRNRKEIQSPEELSQLMLSPNSAVELVYQWLIMTERLSGCIADEVFAELAHCLTHERISKWQIADSSPVLLRLTEIILYRLNQTRFSRNVGELIWIVLRLFHSVMNENGYKEVKPSEDEIIQLNLILSNISQAVEQRRNTISQEHTHGHNVSGLVLQIPKHVTQYNLWRLVFRVFFSIYKYGSSFINLKVAEDLLHAFKFLPSLRPFLSSSTILIECLYRGHDFSFTSFLLQIGAEELVNIPNSDWVYPIDIPICFQKSKLVSLLLQHGAHPDVVNSKGLDPIHSTDNVDIINLLLQHYPLPLCCLAACTIVKSKIPYKQMDLPSHIKKFINLHDSVKM